MSWGFQTDLIVKDIDGTDWLLMTPLVYESLDGVLYTVAAGTVTDLASIPRVFWRVYPKSGPWNPATVLHDDLYARHVAFQMERATADALMREAMHWLHCDALVRGKPREEIGAQTRRNFYYGVRLGGWKAWRTYEAANQKEAA